MRQIPDLVSRDEDPALARSSAGPSARPFQSLTNQNQLVTSLLEDVAWPVRTERLVLRESGTGTDLGHVRTSGRG